MPLEQRLPERSVLDVFDAAATSHGGRTAITMLTTGEIDEVPRSVSYRELLGLVRRAANLFAALAGPRPGVAYLLPNLIETHAVLWGAEAAGYAVPINPLLQADQVAALLEASGAKVLVALGAHPALDIWPKALAVRDRLPGLTLLRVAPPGVPSEPGVVDFDAALAALSDDHLEFGRPGRDGDTAAYFHTGGTTGVPKLVTHTHRGQLVAALGGAVLGDMRPTDTLTATLPLFHVAGTIFCALSVFMAGARLLVMSPTGLRNPAIVRNFWPLMAKHRATLVGSVPTAMAATLQERAQGLDLGSVRAGFCGAAPLPPAVAERFRQLTGRELHQVYGMTEASGMVTTDPLAGTGGEGSVGWALPYTRVEVRRCDAERGLGPICAPGEIGVIVIRGPHVSPGYRNPTHDAGVFESGALDSGDLGYTDRQGRLHIAGRAKDLIIRSGHNIDPLMIEHALAEHPAVALAAAVGMPDAYAGELPVCYVTLKPGASASEQELHEHARRRIGERPAWPKQIHIVEAIALTALGKIYKPPLRCDAAERAVRSLLAARLALADARVAASAGGPRGLRIDVTLPPGRQGAVTAVEGALAVFPFEVRVSVA